MTTVSLDGLMAFAIHPQDWKRPKDNHDYRITNPFDGVDLVNGGLHHADDLGNFRSGDPVRAPLDCVARGLRNPLDGALGIELALGGVTTLEAWHLDRVDIGPDWAPVARGTQLGLTGNSGALIDGKPMPAHTHVEIKRDGLRIDPEPYLLGLALPIEDDMRLPGFQRHIINRQTRTTVASWFRSAPDTSAASRLLVLDPSSLLFPIALVKGGAAGKAPDRTEWYVAIKTDQVDVPTLGFVHSSVLTRLPDDSGVALEPIEGGFTAEDMAAAKVQGGADMKRDIRDAIAKIQPG